MSDSPVSSKARAGGILGGRYRLVRRLGEGGMGAVYEAQHLVVGRRFAVKFLHPEFARMKEMLSRFQREAQTAGTLESENIVGVVDFGAADDGSPYIVMEYLSGRDLRSLIVNDGVLPVPRAAYAAVQACRGLAAAHVQGIVHRDLKPENLFIVRRGDGSDLVKILDFGIAKLRAGGGSSGVSTRAGAVMGTLAYMPPEQVRGDKNIDHRADLYALGAVIYECISGRPPHQGDEQHVVMYKILHEAPPALGTLRAGLPRGLAELVHRALSPDPVDRFQSAAALADALAPFTGRQVTPITIGSDREGGETVLAAASAVRPVLAERGDAGDRTPGRASETDVALEAAGLGSTRRAGRTPWFLLGSAAVLGLGALAIARAWPHGDDTKRAKAPEAAEATGAAPAIQSSEPTLAPLVATVPAPDPGPSTAVVVTPLPSSHSGAVTVRERSARAPERSRPHPDDSAPAPAPAAETTSQVPVSTTELPSPARAKPGSPERFEHQSPYK